MNTQLRAVSRSVILTLSVGAALVTTTPRLEGTDAATLQPPGPTLTELQGIDELKMLFNGDVGKVRLVLLLSPT